MGMSEKDFRKDAVTILESAPDLYLILNTALKIVGASQAYLNATMTERQKIIDKDIFEIFPDNPDDPSATGIENLRNSLNRVLTNKSTDTMAIQKYAIRRQSTDGQFEIRYFSPQNSPVFDKKNNVEYIIHRVVDVTSFIQEKELSGKMEMEMEIHQHVKHIDEVNKQLRVAEAIRLAIIDAIPDAMLTINRAGVITEVNHALETLFGYAQKELLGQQMEILIPEPYRSRHPAHRENYFKSPRVRPMGINMELFGQQKNGHIFSIEISLSPLTTTQGQFAIAIIRDISARVQQTTLLQEKEKALTEANNKLEIEKHNLDISNKKGFLLTELSETLIACKNQDEMIIAISSYASKILDFSKGALYLFNSSHKYLEATSTWGEPDKYEQIITPKECWAIRRGIIHETNASEAGVICDHIKNPKQKLSYICIPVTAQNEVFGLMYTEIEIANDHHARLIEYHLLINMVSNTVALAIANINLRNLLHNQSIHDALTGLYNRRFLDEFLMKQLFYAQRQKSTLAVIMFDLDDFKKINDTHGHEVGDIILEKLGHLMTHMTRAADVICRYGGEEFVCILQNCSLILAKKRAEEFRREIQHITKGPFPPEVTISLGISMYPADGAMANELIEKADKALYESKKTGKNKVTAYSDMN